MSVQHLYIFACVSVFQRVVVLLRLSIDYCKARFEAKEHIAMFNMLTEVLYKCDLQWKTYELQYITGSYEKDPGDIEVSLLMRTREEQQMTRNFTKPIETRIYGLHITV